MLSAGWIGADYIFYTKKKRFLNNFLYLCSKLNIQTYEEEIISYIIGILGCIIIDAAFVAIAIHHEAPVSDYILMGIFLPIIDVAFLVIGSLGFEKSGNKCLVIKLPGTVDDDSLPKLK